MKYNPQDSNTEKENIFILYAQVNFVFVMCVINIDNVVYFWCLCMVEHTCFLNDILIKFNMSYLLNLFHGLCHIDHNMHFYAKHVAYSSVHICKICWWGLFSAVCFDFDSMAPFLY